MEIFKYRAMFQPGMSLDESVTILVPSSTANVGLGYDVWSIGLKEPGLKVVATRTEAPGTGLKIRSLRRPPKGRVLGYSVLPLLDEFLAKYNIHDGVDLSYEDVGDGGYPVGGLGRSGAECVGAIMAACVLFGIKLTPEEVIMWSAKGEPGEHKDNVSASVNGGFNIATNSPLYQKLIIASYPPPDNLGIAIGYSSHKKTMGTEGMRQVLKYPVLAEELVDQTGRVSLATAALVTGNTDMFLEMVIGDVFNEVRRADVKGYGQFTSAQFKELQRVLLSNCGIAIIVSGAGPNMTLLYNKDRYSGGIQTVADSIAVPWFADKAPSIAIQVKPAQIAARGAYDHVQMVYGYAKVA